jgi:ankyrin repeat protein
VKLQKCQGTMSLLHYVRTFEYDDSNIETALGVIKVIYDAHPEAIENHEVASNIHLYHQQVQTFLNGELVYSRQAKDHSLMTKPDDNGQLPLHIALQNNVRLGSIKLLMKGNPSALRALDHNFALPLHVACQHHESASVVQYLLSLSEITLDAVDREGNTALHYACRGAKYDTIALLLEKYGAVSVSKRNAHKKLPIDLLCETNEVLDRESIEYTESIFRLLRAYPETMMNCNVE